MLLPCDRLPSRSPLRLTLALAIALAGCGARTGLRVPSATEDAGTVDAFAEDAWWPPDAAPPCRRDTDCDDAVPCTHDACTPGGCVHTTDDALCDDGRFCDGVETCSLVGCASGVMPCGDGVECTDDGCDEARGACVYTPDDALCPLSNTCDPTRGCLPRLLALDPTALYNIALPSGDLSRITRTDLPLTDIALAEDGTFYAATSRRGLVRLDPRTGVTTPVIPIPGRFYGLEADPGSTALFGGSDDRIVRFDVVTGSVSDVARLPSPEVVSGDFAFVGGRLLVTATTDLGVAPDDLFAIDPRASAPPARIGSTGYPCIFGLAVYRETLYGLTCDGLVLEIDPATAASTVVSRTSIEFDGGAAR